MHLQARPTALSSALLMLLWLCTLLQFLKGPDIQRRVSRHSRAWEMAIGMRAGEVD